MNLQEINTTQTSTARLHSHTSVISARYTRTKFSSSNRESGILDEAIKDESLPASGGPSKSVVGGGQSSDNTAIDGEEDGDRNQGEDRPQGRKLTRERAMVRQGASTREARTSSTVSERSPTTAMEPICPPSTRLEPAIRRRAAAHVHIVLIDAYSLRSIPPLPVLPRHRRFEARRLNRPAAPSACCSAERLF